MPPIVLLYFISAVLIIILQPNVQSLNWNLTKGLAITTILATIPVTALYIKHKLNPLQNPALFLARWGHYFSFLLSISYILIFHAKYDKMYLSFIFILYFHWIFIKGECIFTYAEQKLMDSNYKMGSDIYNHPWLNLLIGKQNVNPILVISYIFVILNVSTVSKRFFTNQIIYYIIVFVLLANSLKSNIERYQRSSSVTSIGIS